MAYRFAGAWTEPESSYCVVVSAAIAHPIGGVIDENHHLVFRHVGFAFIAEPEFADVESVERLSFFQQVVYVDAVGAVGIGWYGVLVILVPVYYEVFAFLRSRFRPCVFIVRVGFLLEQGVGSFHLPLVWDVKSFLREG